jgi:CDP-diacylglycerol--serine O-phosphatidyltransferase
MNKKIIPQVKFPRKRKRLKYIAILPSLVTLMNGLCGFTAIVFASRGEASWRPLLLPRINLTYFALAGYFIFFAMIADVLDGHVARISKTTSSFGAQLDSLCDIISFGVAPAFLMLKLIEAQNFEYGNIRVNQFFGKAVYLIAIIYAMCAVIRLARFNVENKEEDSSHLSFAGLPSPPAAGSIVSIVIFQQDFLPKIENWPAISVRTLQTVSVWALPVITLIAGILMVTRIPYPHIVSRILRGKKRFSTFLLVLLVLLLTIWNIQLAMVLGFSFFVLFGILRWLCLKIYKKKKEIKTEETAQP